MKKLIDEDPVYLHSYSMGNGFPEVREIIAKSYRDNYKFPASADNVFITSGAAGAIKASINAVVAPDEEIILITPYFAEYYM
ncbi:MAG: aminotransferase class I/II-fold pyridoxal phosphate-dependent enzyme [bacterium]|nr:aminotransferase class I/II-fold pyridoxal phosphate-dependent enzyme [bacterium]